MHTFIVVCVYGRLFGLSFILFLQLWVGWTFLHYQMERSDKQKQGSTSAADSTAIGQYCTLYAGIIVITIQSLSVTQLRIMIWQY